jgi:peptidoglycan/xylan/chitin deacetylase (PgdA/CDA1 family)
VSAQLAPPLAVVLSFHGVVERIAHPEIQVNHVELESFERIVERVRAQYEVVTVDDVVGAVRGETTLPENAAALTFDDAYRSVLELAEPQLTGLPYTVFVPSSFISSGERVPTYVMRAALAFTKQPSVRLPGRRRAFKLRTADDRRRAGAHAALLLRESPLDEAEDTLGRLRELLSTDEWHEIDGRFPSEALLGWSELADLGKRDVTVGSHTRDHVVLHRRQTVDDIDEQLRESKAEIERMLDLPCRHFCFPHGQPRDVSREAVEAAREAGYSSAFMNVGGPVREGMDPLLLPRIPIAGSPPDAPLADRAQLSHSKWYAEVAAELELG